MLSPEEIMKNWTAFGAGAQDQLSNLLASSVDMSMGATRPK
jgi:hypothetical protein